MEILGLVFAGSATDRRAAMAMFVESTLGLRRVDADADSDIFVMPDGTRFGVSDEREVGQGTSRTIGFLVADLAAAVAELRAAGVDVDDPDHNDRHEYAHFYAPDGKLYELVQERTP